MGVCYYMAEGTCTYYSAVCSWFISLLVSDMNDLFCFCDPRDLGKLESNVEVNWDFLQLVGFRSLEICCKLNFHDLNGVVGISRFNFRGISTRAVGCR